MPLIFFGRALNFFLVFLIMRIATTFLTPNEMGRMSLILSAIAIFALFLVNPVGLFVNRRLYAWKAKGLVKYYLNYYWAYLLVVALLASMSLSYMNSFELLSLKIHFLWIWLLVSGSLTFNIANQTLIPSLNLFGYSGLFIGLTLATQVLGLLFSVLLIYYLSPCAEFWLLGFLAAQVLFAVIGGKIFFKKLAIHQKISKKTITRKQINVLLGFAWPILISVGMLWIQNHGYRFFIQSSLGIEAVGLFVVGFGIGAGLIAAFENVLLTYYQPLFYKDIHRSSQKIISQAWAGYASGIIPPLLLLICYIFVMSPELAKVLLEARYYSSYKYIIWGALAESLRAIASVYNMASHALMKTHLMMLGNIVGALVSLLQLFFMTPRFGLIGVGISLSFSGFFMIAIMHIIIGKEVNLRLPNRRIIQATLMGLLVIGFGVAIKFLTDSSQTFLLSFLVLSIVGVFLLAMQFLLFRGFSRF